MQRRMKNISQVSKTIFQANNLGETKPIINIGGSDRTKFVPNINMSFFDDEFYFNLNRKDKIINNEIVIFNNNKISQTTDDVDEYYIDEKGNLKWDITWNKKPKNLNLEFDISCSDNLSFLYQDTLFNDWLKTFEKSPSKFSTFESYAKRHHRPLNAEGSYAVYCDKRNNKYKTGKLFHIYAVTLIDAVGNTKIVSIKIEDKKLKIELPEKFFEDAVYPVKADPEFGYHTIGASYLEIWSDDVPWGSVYDAYTASTGDIITQLSWYGNTYGASGTLQISAYTVSGGNLSVRLGSVKNITYDVTTQWYDTATISDAMSNGVTYGIGFTAYGGGRDARVYYDTSGTNYAQSHDTSENLPATWSVSSTAGYIFSLYAVYTGGGGSPSASPSVSPSVSPSGSPSISLSVSPSFSPSISPSISPSVSPSASPSGAPPEQDYTRGDYIVLPGDDTDLETNYSSQDLIDVTSKDDIRVGQSANQQYMIHQFKEYIESANSCTVEAELQSTLAPSSSTVYLQVYNQNTSTWETLDSDNSSNADTDFTLEGSVPNLTNYIIDNMVSFRIYQLAL